MYLESTIAQRQISLSVRFSQLNILGEKKEKPYLSLLLLSLKPSLLSIGSLVRILLNIRGTILLKSYKQLKNTIYIIIIRVQIFNRLQQKLAIQSIAKRILFIIFLINIRQFSFFIRKKVLYIAQGRGIKGVALGLVLLYILSYLLLPRQLMKLIYSLSYSLSLSLSVILI